MTRIVTDIANTFNKKSAGFNITAISPSYSYLTYRAGMHVLLAADINNNKVWQDFYELRRCCWYFSQRWLVAGLFPCIWHFLDKISTTNPSIRDVSRHSWNIRTDIGNEPTVLRKICQPEWQPWIMLIPSLAWAQAQFLSSDWLISFIDSSTYKRLLNHIRSSYINKIKLNKSPIPFNTQLRVFSYFASKLARNLAA